MWLSLSLVARKLERKSASQRTSHLGFGLPSFPPLTALAKSRSIKAFTFIHSAIVTCSAPFVHSGFSFLLEYHDIWRLDSAQDLDRIAGSHDSLPEMLA